MQKKAQECVVWLGIVGSLCSHNLSNDAIHKQSPLKSVNKSQLYMSNKNDSNEVQLCHTKI